MNNASVLIVDDEPGILKALSRLLEDEDYDIDLAESAQGAIGFIESKSYDAVICDQNLPDRPGLSVLRHVYENSPETVRIMITGTNPAELTEKLINECRISYFISKPWDDGVLVDNLKRLVSSKREGEERKRIIDDVFSNINRYITDYGTPETKTAAAGKFFLHHIRNRFLFDFAGTDINVKGAVVISFHNRGPGVLVRIQEFMG
ncbi:MAG: response regulator, partial [Clostridiales bacterium]|nr:response regulator [Clostridiales bacterium]